MDGEDVNKIQNEFIEALYLDKKNSRDCLKALAKEYLKKSAFSEDYLMKYDISYKQAINELKKV